MGKIIGLKMLSALKGTHRKGQAQKCNTMTYETRLRLNIKGALLA